MSCCPPNAEGFLASSIEKKGTKETLPSGLEFYSSGSKASKKAVMLIPDVWGWDSGRTRNIADLFAEAGYLAVIPKLLTPPLEGGTDGDGLPPNFVIPERFPDFGAYFSKFPWDVLRPKVAELVTHLGTLGVEKTALMGFCWGGWVCAHILADAELSALFTCAAVPHPSVGLEAMFFKGDPVELMGKVTKPMLLMPAKGDEGYDAGGNLFEAVKANNPTSETTSEQFKHVNHGFSSRGDIADGDVKAAVSACIDKACGFIGAHF